MKENICHEVIFLLFTCSTLLQILNWWHRIAKPFLLCCLLLRLQMLQGQWELQGGLLSLTVFSLTAPFSWIICWRSGHGDISCFSSLFYSSSSCIFLCKFPDGSHSSLFLLRLILWWLKTGNSAKSSSGSCHRSEALLIQSRWRGSEHTPLLSPFTGAVPSASQRQCLLALDGKKEQAFLVISCNMWKVLKTNLITFMI